VDYGPQQSRWTTVWRAKPARSGLTTIRSFTAVGCGLPTVGRHPIPIHFRFSALHPEIPHGWSKKLWGKQPATYFWCQIDVMIDVMISKRKILVVIGIAVAIIIGVYTGLFGMSL
jgi:hypothetical protein